MLSSQEGRILSARDYIRNARIVATEDKQENSTGIKTPPTDLITICSNFKKVTGNEKTLVWTNPRRKEGMDICVCRAGHAVLSSQR